MSTHPIDIIANEIVDAKLSSPFSARVYAEAAVKALTDDAIVANAVQALLADGWRRTHEGPYGFGELTDEDLANIARVVLGSVAGR